MAKKRSNRARNVTLTPTVKKWYAEGVTKTEILRRLGDDAPCIDSLNCMLHGLDKSQAPEITPALKAEVVARQICGGYSYVEAGWSVGRSGGTVSKWKKQLYCPDTMAELDFEALVEAMIDAEHRRLKEHYMAQHSRKQSRKNQRKFTVSDKATSPAEPADRREELKPDVQAIVDKARESMSPKQEADLADEQVMFNGREVSQPLNTDELPDDVDALKKMLEEERFLRAAAEASVVVLGKGGAPVTNRDKTTIVALLSNKGFTQKRGQCWAQLAKPTFHRLLDSTMSAVQRKHHQRLKTIATTCAQIARQQATLSFSAGYRQVKAVLQRQGVVISEKLLRKAMAILGMQGTRKGLAGYSSYHGENDHVPDNLLMLNDKGELTAPGGPLTRFQGHKDVLAHDFHADRPGQRFVTDISEIKCSDGKLYLSPLIDLYDKDITSFAVGYHPNMALVMAMLETGLAAVREEFPDAVPVIHSDRGIHYRNNTWCNAVNGHDGPRFIPSMSRKGKSGDNAACEGFFGLMKQELGFLRRRSETITRAEAIWRIDRYIQWYRYQRIHTPLGRKTIAEHRGWTTAANPIHPAA